jgi:hypothetical protein
MIARTHTLRHARHPMGNYVSDRVGNYLSATPLQVGNFVSADTTLGPDGPTAGYLRRTTREQEIRSAGPTPCGT